MITTKLQTTLFFWAIISVTALGQTNSGRTNLGIEYAKKELKDALTNKTDKLILADKVITDKETAVSTSETILFKIYGKNNIVKQRPYEVNKIDNYWILNGTLPEKMHGGTFLIIINSSNGQIIKLTHGK
jgi:NTF2 fold immunity protein